MGEEFLSTDALIHSEMLQIGMMLICAKLAEGALSRFGLSPFVAYIAIGFILGPTVLDIVHPAPELLAFLGIGGFLFFFLIGLDEIDIRGFVSNLRGRIFVAASISVIASLMVSMIVTYDLFFEFGLNLLFTEALALAGVLALSSLGVVAKELSDSGRLSDPIGIQMFTTVIVAELLAMLVVGFTIGEHDYRLHLGSMLWLGFKIALFTIAAWVLAIRVIPPVIVHLQRLLNAPFLSFGLILGIMFMMVIAAEAIGLHGKLGALLFGTALSGLPSQVRRDVVPGMRSVAEGLFVPLFFASAGLHLNFSFVELPGWTIAGLVLIPLAGKAAGAFVGALAARFEKPFPLAMGLMAKGVAEIALMLVMLDAGVIDEEVFSLLAMVMFAYILLTPLAIRFTINRAGPTKDIKLPDHLPPSLVTFAIDHVTVGDIIDRGHLHPNESISVREFANRWIDANQHDYVVVDRDGNFSGIVSLSLLRYLPKENWADTPLREVVRRNSLRAWPDELAEDALQRMSDNSITTLPVMERETENFLGTVTSASIIELITLEARGRHTGSGQ